jgi:hypothetical protein
MSTLTWADVTANPYLKDLPFKFEMSPASNRHGIKQVALSRELSARPSGQALVECSVQTTDGVRVANDDQRTVIAPPRP